MLLAAPHCRNPPESFANAREKKPVETCNGSINEYSSFAEQKEEDQHGKYKKVGGNEAEEIHRSS